MLSEKKIKIMFKLAEYEQNDGKKDLKVGQYYKSDFIRYNILKSILNVTAAFLLIVLVCSLYNMEYLISKAVVLDYKLIASSVLGIYLLVILLYVFITISISSIKFDAARKRLQKYYNYLRLLTKYYQEDSE